MSVVLIATCTYSYGSQICDDELLNACSFASNKVVADGAVSFYIDHFVSARVSKLAYGVSIWEEYQPYNPEHRCREKNKFMTPGGCLGIGDIFSAILAKVTLVYSIHQNFV